MTPAEAAHYLPRFLRKTIEQPPTERPWWTGSSYETRTVTCREWIGATNDKGFGRFGPGRQWWSSHKFAYHVHRGPIPAGHVVDHLCRNRRCVTPEHLEAVPPQQSQDRTTLYYRGLTALCPSGIHVYAETEMFNGKGHRYCGQCNRDRVKAASRRPPAKPLVIPAACCHGHPLTPGSVYVNPAGSCWYCRECNRAARRRYEVKHPRVA